MLKEERLEQYENETGDMVKDMLGEAQARPIRFIAWLSMWSVIETVVVVTLYITYPFYYAYVIYNYHVTSRVYGHYLNQLQRRGVGEQ